tara:strand:+ start:459 stop:599 length:141 start_codon:yes stop_codon:yes gene_type:complete
MSIVKINLPNSAILRINYVIEEHGIFEDHEDFIQHAITDLLEEYRS